MSDFWKQHSAHFGQSGGNQSDDKQQQDQHQGGGSGSGRSPQGGWTPPASTVWTPPAQVGWGAAGFRENITGGQTPERHFVKAPVRKLWGGVSQREKDNNSASPALGGDYKTGSWNSSSAANNTDSWNSPVSSKSGSYNTGSYNAGVGCSSHNTGSGSSPTSGGSHNTKSSSVKDSVKDKKTEKSGSSL